MNKKAVVTGASGYLGTHLVEHLIKEGWSMTAYDLQKNTRLLESVRFISGDIRDAEKVSEACSGCDVIFHLVGIMPQAKASEKIMHDVNVGGTKNVLDAAVKNKARRVVFLSSCEIYGTWENVPVKEDDAVHPIGEYGRNKLEAEKLGKEYSEKYGLEFAALRPSTIVGKNMTDYLFKGIMKGILKSPFFFYIGNGQNRFQMSATDDVVDACLLSATKENLKYEVFNIGADDTPTIKEQIQRIGSEMGLNRKMIGIPAAPAKKFLHLLTALGISPFVPDHFEVMDKDILMECSKAKKILGWQPKKNNVEMIVEALNSYKKELEETHG